MNEPNNSTGAGTAGASAVPDTSAVPDSMAVTTAVRTVRLIVATSRNARARNEDAIGVAGWVLHAEHPDPLEISITIGPGSPCTIAVVDGMSGHPDGDRAARIAAEQLTRPAPPGESTEITAAFRRADTAIRIAAGNRSRGMGCTAATLSLAADGRASIANVGDVRVYRILDGYLGQLTVDDRPVGAATGAVTRCLGGNEPTVTQTHVQHLTLRPGDRLVFCSDGLPDAVALTATRLPGRLEANRLVTELMAAALGAGNRDDVSGDGGDNVTVAVVELPAEKRASLAASSAAPKARRTVGRPIPPPATSHPVTSHPVAAPPVAAPPVAAPPVAAPPVAAPPVAVPSAAAALPAAPAPRRSSWLRRLTSAIRPVRRGRRDPDQ